jgi:DNA-binding transcriptional LysR family regulator
MDQLKSMRTFVRVIDEGSFAAAARAMDAAPAVVTRAVADLEEHLGTRLLNRTTRRIALTDIGERYLERARAILSDIDEAAALASAAHTEPRGNVRVLCAPAFAVHQLAKRLPRFHAAYPQVTIEVTAFGPVDSLDEGHDITIVVRRDNLDGDFVARRLARSEVVTCASPEYLDRRGRPQSPQELLGHDALIPPASDVQRGITFFRGPWGDAGPGGEIVTVAPGRPVLSSFNLDLNYASALAGLGIAGLPSFMAEDALHENALERVLPQWRLFVFTIWACMPTRKHVPASTRAFMDFLLAEFGGEDADPWLFAAGCETRLPPSDGPPLAGGTPSGGSERSERGGSVNAA